jgi:serine/threonine protein phosphatase PrpC
VLCCHVAAAVFSQAPAKLVISQPDVTVQAVQPTDLFLVMACDGVWDVLSDDDAIAIAAKHFGQPKDAAEAVVRQAYSRGSRDNLTATVVQFFWQADRFSELMQAAQAKKAAAERESSNATAAGGAGGDDMFDMFG